jgi:hypothetical protein
MTFLCGTCKQGVCACELDLHMRELGHVGVFLLFFVDELLKTHGRTFSMQLNANSKSALQAAL